MGFERKSSLFEDEEVPFGVNGEERERALPLIVGIFVIVAIALAIGVFSLWNASHTPAFTIETSDESTTETTSTQSSSTIFVYVSGCVTQPGVYELQDGDRIVNALDAAGGMTDEAATDNLNLAESLMDGEKIRVPSAAEVQASVASVAATTDDTVSSASGSGSGSAGGSSSAIDANGRVNINQATAEELETVSGIGPATAQKIIAERSANGPFSSVDDLTRVSGIGEKRLANMREHLFV